MELNELKDELIGKVKGLVEDGNLSMEGKLKGLVDEIKDANEKSVSEIDERISSIEVEMKKAQKEAKEQAPKTLLEQLKSAFDENKDEIQGVADGSRKGFKLNLKVAANISSSNISGGDVPQADRLGGFNIIPSRTVRLMDLVSRATTTSDKIEWVYQANKDGAAGATAEGQTKNKIDFDWVVGSEEVKKKTAFIKVTDEMLAKGAIVAQEINNELIRELSKACEAGVYEDDATGSNLRGLTTVASAFDASVAGTTDIENANIVDVLATAMTQIRIAQEGGANINAIMMNPSDVLQLKLQKLSSTDKRYVGRLLDAGMGLSVDGVAIVESTLVTAGTYLIGDFSKAELVQREGMSIEFGYDSDDFTKNFRTIRAEWRGALVVRNNNRSAFVFGTFADDIAALEALSV